MRQSPVGEPAATAAANFATPRRRSSAALRPLFWSYDFSRIDLERHRKMIIVQVLNYGTFNQWRWLIETYGREAVRMVLQQIPATEIKPRTRRLVTLVFDAPRFNYAPRGSQKRVLPGHRHEVFVSALI
jgi:hypothetical protein